MSNQLFRFTSPSRKRNTGFPMIQTEIPIAKKRENVKIELQTLQFLNKRGIRSKGNLNELFEPPKNDLHKITKPESKQQSKLKINTEPNQQTNLEGLRKHFEKMFYYKENISELLKEYLENPTNNISVKMDELLFDFTKSCIEHFESNKFGETEFKENNCESNDDYLFDPFYE